MAPAHVVISDITGATGQRILRDIVNGQLVYRQRASTVDGSLRAR